MGFSQMRVMMVRFFRIAIPLVALLVGAGLYMNPMHSRTPMNYRFADLFFWMLFAVSMIEMAAMRFAASSVRKRIIEEKGKPGNGIGEIVVISAMALSTAVYPVFYYISGGPVDKSIILLVPTMLGYIHFNLLLPGIEAAQASDETPDSSD